jgi:hypothetical protein
LYVGSYRPSKGQLSFLRKADASSLGPYRVEFYGVRQPDLGDDWEALTEEARRFKGKVHIRDERVSHEALMRAFSRASGLIHYSAGDRRRAARLPRRASSGGSSARVAGAPERRQRFLDARRARAGRETSPGNPRVLYEALVFGLPVLVSAESMPYVGLQCEAFVTITNANSSEAALNRDLAAFVASLDAPDARRRVRAYAAHDLREFSVLPPVRKQPYLSVSPRRASRILPHAYRSEGGGRSSAAPEGFLDVAPLDARRGRLPRDAMSRKLPSLNV